MRLVRAKRGDVLEISDCRKESILNVNSDSYTEDAISEFIEDNKEEQILEDISSINVYCLKKRGKVVGTISFYENKIDGLYVRPGYSGKGYGRRLLRFAEKKILKKYDNILLYSTLNSESFYVRNGYHPGEVCISFSENPMAFVEMKK